MLRLSGESTGSTAHVHLLDWYDLYSQVILVLERPVPCTNLFRYCRSRTKPTLEEDKAKVSSWNIHVHAYGSLKDLLRWPWSTGDMNVSPQTFSFPSQAIMKQLIEEVKLFDRKGIFHRDLKLENILINTNSREPRIWVIDFGVGCFFTQRSVFRIFQGKNFPFALVFHPRTC